MTTPFDRQRLAEASVPIVSKLCRATDGEPSAASAYALMALLVTLWLRDIKLPRKDMHDLLDALYDSGKLEEN